MHDTGFEEVPACRNDVLHPLYYKTCEPSAPELLNARLELETLNAREGDGIQIHVQW